MGARTPERLIMSNDGDMMAALEAAERKLDEARRAMVDGERRGLPAEEQAELAAAKNRAWKHLEAVRAKFSRR